jgi:hypothetical protein
MNLHFYIKNEIKLIRHMTMVDTVLLTSGPFSPVCLPDLASLQRKALHAHRCPVTPRMTKRCPLEYKTRIQTVVETPSYIRAAEAIFSETEHEAIVAMVAADPECGEVIQGTAEFRKVRIGRSGMGKRGGSRVIYPRSSPSTRGKTWLPYSKR